MLQKLSTVCYEISVAFGEWAKPKGSWESFFLLLFLGKYLDIYILELIVFKHKQKQPIPLFCPLLFILDIQVI